MRNYIGNGDRVRILAFFLAVPAHQNNATAASGDLVAFYDRVGVLCQDLPPDFDGDAMVDVLTRGEFLLTGPAGIDIDGTAVYLDLATGDLTRNSGAGPFVGYPHWYEEIGGGKRQFNVVLGWGAPPTAP